MKTLPFIAALLCGLAPVFSLAQEQPGDPHRARQVLDANGFESTYTHTAAADSPLVVVFGENHASVKTQVELSGLLRALIEANAIGAVFVEGSEGEMDVARIAAQFARAANGRDLSGYWKDQLESGQISGFEAACLQHPSTPVVGVEDMVAKHRFQVQRLSSFDQENVDTEEASLRRGLEGLREALKEIKASAKGTDASEAEKLVAQFEAAIGSLNQAGLALVAAAKPHTDLQLRALQVFSDRLALVKTIPDFDQAAEWSAQLSEMVEDFSKFDEAKARELSKKLDIFSEKNAAKIARMGELGEELDRIEAQLEKASEESSTESEQKAFVAADEAAEDLFFQAANQVTALVPREGQSAALREKLEFLNDFFLLEAERREKEQERNYVAELRERDQKMAENTAARLQEHKFRCVALVVGSAHLPGIAEQLQAQRLSFVAGPLQGNDDYDAWEAKAWEKRRLGPGTSIFADSPGIKEESVFTAPKWVAEQEKRIMRFFDSERTSPKLGKGRVLHEGENVPDVKQPYGDHVEMHQQGKIVVNEEKAKELTRTESGDDLEVAYGYKKDGEYRVHSPSGDRSLEEAAERLRNPDGPDSTPVLFFKEPDIIERGGVQRSRFMEGFRGGDDGKPPKPPNSAAPGAGDPGGWRGRLHQTIDAKRGAANIRKLAQQKSVKPKEITFVDFEGGMTRGQVMEKLRQIPYTGKEGDHAGMVVFVARNLEEFRYFVRIAGKTKKLKNKQVGLVFCGDLIGEGATLRESILSDGGALMVWTTERKITPEAGQALIRQAKQLRDEAQQSGGEFEDVGHFLNQALDRLWQEQPEAAEPFLDSSKWVLVPARRERLGSMS